jgi:uncharacterized short protein YbdD (DUF466 family)
MFAPNWPKSIGRLLQRGWLNATAYWQLLNGDTAYARYLAHWHAQHGHGTPLSRGDFFQAELNRRWSGVRRCC